MLTVLSGNDHTGHNSNWPVRADLQLIEALMAVSRWRMANGPVDVLTFCENDSRAHWVKEVVGED